MVTAVHQLSSSDAPRFSVCICTRNRPGDLARALRSVEASTYPAHQIVVSDDSTDTLTREMIAADFPRAVFLEGPRRGLGANRNCALGAVTGTHVAFIDDDATLSTDFLSQMAESLQHGGQHPEKLIVTGYELNRGERVYANATTFLGFQARPYRTRDHHDTVVINSAVFPAWLFKLIRFDEHLVYGYDEVDIVMEVFNSHFPSTVNRDYYAAFVEASRIYVTHKRYRWFERNRPKAALFLTLAVAHNLLHNLRAHGPKGVARSARTVSHAIAYIRRYSPEGRAIQHEDHRTRTHLSSNLGSRSLP